jgi:hypothetical protein
VSLASNLHPNRGRVWAAAGLLIAANLYVLFAVLLRKRARALRRGVIFVGFVLTLVGLVGVYASANLAASHAEAMCYANAAGSGIVLTAGDAVYFGLSTLTTAGFGDIVAHSHTCRWLTTSELAVGLATLGLSVAAVAARIFEDRSPSMPPPA